MSFIIAGIIAVGTIAICALGVLAEMSKPIPDSGSWIIWTFVFGLGLAALVAISHWLPHIGW